ncbi:MAG TPA: ABC-type transport auxiliary lipoprotein family protein [Noviherbaspirillum sp.]
MRKTFPTTVALLLASIAMLLAGCATVRPDAAALYDLGAPGATANAGTLPSLPPISIAEIHAPAWLDSTMIFYRLNYANGQQPRPYADARWAMTPAQLLSLHLKSRIAQSGGVVLSASDAASSLPMLRIEAEDFTQVFDAPGQSHGKVDLRASVFKGRALIAQKTFRKQAPAPTADAAGGVRALAAASEAAIAELITWLSTLELK